MKSILLLFIYNFIVKYNSQIYLFYSLVNSTYRSSSIKQKIFLIGRNKTATTSIHRLFIYNIIKSLHWYKWFNIEKYDAFTDSI